MNDRLQIDSTATQTSLLPTHLDQNTYRPPPLNSELQDRNSNLLLDYLRTLTRFRWIIALCAAAGILLSLLFNLNTLPSYRARTSTETL